jgi:L-lactate dehydrogenase complex protein LldG
MSAFHKLIATVKSALGGASRLAAPDAAIAAHAPAPAPAVALRSIVPVAQNARRTELTAQFARELEAVGGVFLGAYAPDEIRARVVALARELGAHTAAVGAGVTLDADPIAQALEQAGVAVIRPRPTGAGPDDAARATFRHHIANCDLGIAEADAGIAATGTLAVIGAPNRPNSLTLLPPNNLVFVNADRMRADLAAAIAGIGAETFTAKRVALITGPSRTADIEKMIVLGVHGPKKLYVLVVWPRDP